MQVSCLVFQRLVGNLEVYMHSDPIADCLTRVYNGAKAGKEVVVMPHSKAKETILNLLRNEGYLSDVRVADKEGRKFLEAAVRYQKSGEPVIQAVKRISKPGRRVYEKAPEGLNVRAGLGVKILSTSKGVLTDRDALAQKVGGEVIGEVW